MALTRSFKELVQRRVTKDPAFGAALLREGIDTMLAGDVDTGKAILRDYIKATIGFEKLGEATGTQPKSLIRMFGPRGNPALCDRRFRIIGRHFECPVAGHRLSAERSHDYAADNAMRRAFAPSAAIIRRSGCEEIRPRDRRE